MLQKPWLTLSVARFHHGACLGRFSNSDCAATCTFCGRFAFRSARSQDDKRSLGQRSANRRCWSIRPPSSSRFQHMPMQPTCQCRHRRAARTRSPISLPWSSCETCSSLPPGFGNSPPAAPREIRSPQIAAKKLPQPVLPPGHRGSDHPRLRDKSRSSRRACFQLSPRIETPLPLRERRSMTCSQTTTLLQRRVAMMRTSFHCFHVIPRSGAWVAAG